MIFTHYTYIRCGTYQSLSTYSPVGAEGSNFLTTGTILFGLSKETSGQSICFSFCTAVTDVFCGNKDPGRFKWIPGRIHETCYEYSLYLTKGILKPVRLNRNRAVGAVGPVFDANHKNSIPVKDLTDAVREEVGNPKHIRQRFTVGNSYFIIRTFQQLKHRPYEQYSDNHIVMFK